MISDEESYELYLKKAREENESLCRRCGACCGVSEKDPCVHLEKKADGTYFCAIYDKRFGIHKTVNGNEFKCVPLRNILSGFWYGAVNCGYKRRMRKV